MIETNRIEFKRELTRELDIEKEVVAFLNYREGGIIYIGITDDGKPVENENIEDDMLALKNRIRMTKEEFFSGISSPRNKELMRVFRDVDMVESLGSGMKRILQAYPKRIYIFMDNFIRLTIPFYSQKGSKIVHANSTSSRKNSTSSKKEFLLAYCAIPRSITEMMHYMNMHSRYSFISTYINPLLAEGLLQCTIPDQPTHPKQQYVAKQK